MSEENIHRLEGSGGGLQGGLVIRKKKAEESGFKAPQSSLLGLDKLAAIKEKERREKDEKERDESAAKKFKSSGEDSRNYRYRQDETPTYTGGVNKNVYDRQRQDRKDRGIVASSSSKTSKDRGRKDDRDEDRSRHRSSRDRDPERSERSRRDNDRSERSNRGDDWSERRNRNQRPPSSRRERERDWEIETPR